jgi:hypothetical protein
LYKNNYENDKRLIFFLQILKCSMLQ